VIEAVCIVLGIDTKTKTPEGYFAEAKKSTSFLNQPPVKLIQSLCDYEKETRLNAKLVKKIGTYVNDAEGRLVPENVLQVSSACGALAKFVNAMYNW